MKRILFITTRNPYSGRYSGDVIRSFKIINLLKRRYKIDLVFLGRKDNLRIKDLNVISFEQPNYLKKILYCIISLLKLEPIQFGLFYSESMKNYIQENSNNYDVIFFHHIRSSQFLPKDYYGKTILDMGDLYSDNYSQTSKYLSFLNPLKYIYYLESLIIKSVEAKIFSIFDEVLLFSKKEVDKANKSYDPVKKIIQIDESVEKLHKKLSFSSKKLKILFVGNLNYLPNILACKNFIKDILPRIRIKIPNIKFCIIGDIKDNDRSHLSKYNNVEILGMKKDISKYAKNSICGIANLSIATGVQVKVLTYMTYGLPVICSDQVAKNFDKNVLTYKSNSDLIDKIIKLKNKKNFWNSFSKKSYFYVKKFKWKNISKKYFKIVDA